MLHSSGIAMPPCGDVSSPGTLLLSTCYGVLQRKEQNKQARTGLCFCRLSTMWLKAMIWRSMFAILVLALACLAAPISSGWPEFTEGLDEKVETSTWKLWEVVECAAVICELPPALSSLRTTIIAFEKRLPTKLVSPGPVHYAVI